MESALERIEGDYIAQRITAPQWTRLEAKLTEQIEAARNQAEQHERQRRAIVERIAEFDAEGRWSRN